MSEETINRKHKDRLFKLIFDDKENLLALYNAINGTTYEDPSLLEITTIENAIYMSMRNDLSFIVDSLIMNFYEHQSSFCRNMPICGLIYAARIYQKFIAQHKLNMYGRLRLSLPAPRYIVFYNGDAATEDCIKLRLSDMFTVPDDSDPPEFEWTATMLNINLGHNRELLERCRPLLDFSTFVDKIKTYLRQMTVAEAADIAIRECIEEGVLADFLIKHRSEVFDVVLTEYDDKIAMEALYESIRAEALADGRAEGLQEGRAEGRAKGFQEEIAKKLKEAGVDIAIICKATGLPLEIVKEL